MLAFSALSSFTRRLTGWVVQHDVSHSARVDAAESERACVQPYTNESLCGFVSPNGGVVQRVRRDVILVVCVGGLINYSDSVDIIAVTPERTWTTA